MHTYPASYYKTCTTDVNPCRPPARPATLHSYPPPLPPPTPHQMSVSHGYNWISNVIAGDSLIQQGLKLTLAPSPGPKPRPQAPAPSPGPKPRPQAPAPSPGPKPRPQAPAPSPGPKPRPQAPAPSPGPKPRPQAPAPSPGPKPWPQASIGINIPRYQDEAYQGSRNPLARSPRRVLTMSGLVESQELLVPWATNVLFRADNFWMPEYHK